MAKTEGPLQHRLCLSIEKDPSLSSPMYSLGSDSPHQWSEHRPGATSVGLWVTHNDPIAILSLPPPLLIGVSDDRVKGADCTTLLEAHGEDSDRHWGYILAEEKIGIIDEFRKEARLSYNVFQWETSANKAPHRDLYFADVPGLSEEEVTTISRGYMAPSFTTTSRICHLAT